jgi:RNA polymerase sigma-70 factor (ECF subfamily)
VDSQLNDEVLMTRIGQGDAAALEILYDRHASMILGIALRITGDQTQAEEIVQETFWQVWRSAAAYQFDSGSFNGWLFRIARSLARK